MKITRKGNKEDKQLIEQRLNAVSARWTDPTMVEVSAETAASTTTGMIENTPIKEEDDESSSSGQESIDNMEIVYEKDFSNGRPSDIEIPEISYFEIRRDKDKRAYVESFTEIVGRVKTNYQFRCKGCGELLIGQYLNMLVHMSGTYNHLSVRARACPKPFPAMKAKILQDYTDYNSKQNFLMSQVKREPGSFIGKVVLSIKHEPICANKHA